MRWGGPIGIVVLAAVLRLQNLGMPSSLMFDETFYVKDAWTVLHLGYEGSWPTNPNPAFNSGDVNSYNDSASYPAHPPLGKWMIALGMAIFGGNNTFGWRFSVAVVGILAVILIMLIAQKLFKNLTLTLIAGGLFAIEGHAIVLSRISLLDNFVMFFALLGFGAILLDRDWTRRRFDLWVERHRSGELRWGPTLWARPWLIAAGVAFGATTAVKWSGLYYLAFFAIYVLAVDAVMRRRAGIRFWYSATLLKQGPATFLLMVPVAAVTYISTFTGWFVTRGGIDRNWIGEGNPRWGGVLSWVPDAVQNLWHWHSTIYQFHTTLSTPHPYQSQPFLWLLMLRPTSIYYKGTPLGQDGCTFSSCSEQVTSIANPIIWYAAVAAMLYLVYRLVRYREWKVGLILMGVAAGYLPWLLYPNRTVFEFYTIAFEPYMLLALTFVIGLLIGDKQTDIEKRDVGRRAVVIFLILAVVVSAFFYPEWTAIRVPLWFWQLHNWIPSWV
jgi:dolichyl-phosphate-mannose-protein mannosyltransferase